MKKKSNVFFMILLLFYCWSCNDSDPHGSSYDPSLPVVINNFLPDSGGIRTKFIVEGSNFGTEPGKVKVYFNNKEALILGVKNDMVYAQVPKQPGDSCIVSVVVGQDSCIFQEKKFVYRIQASVSTVLGKLNEGGSGGFVDGSLAEAMIYYPRYVTIDHDNNLFICETEAHRVRMAALNSDKIITLADRVFDYPNKPGFTKDRKNIYIPTDSQRKIYSFEADREYGVRLFCDLTKHNMGYMHSCTVGPDDKYIYARNNGGEVYKIELAQPMNVEILPEKFGPRGDAWVVYNPVDNMFYMSHCDKCMIYRANLEGTIVEEFAGDGRAGFADGPAKLARFNEPQGLAVDSEGNLYIADTGNHRIRKVTLDGIVSTVAGTGEDGFKDGKPEEAQFNRPWDVAIDKNDFVYIADNENHRIRLLAVE